MFTRLFCKHDFHLVGHGPVWSGSIGNYKETGHKFEILCFLCGKVKNDTVATQLETTDAMNYARVRGWLK